jgi:hypothetical protein
VVEGQIYQLTVGERQASCGDVDEEEEHMG